MQGGISATALNYSMQKQAPFRAKAAAAPHRNDGTLECSEFRWQKTENGWQAT